MAIAQQEIFAPVMTVLKYDTLDEAVAIANGTRYGLGAAVFGRRRDECRWVMERLECGMVCSNGASSSFSPFFELALTSLSLSQTLAVRPRSLSLSLFARSSLTFSTLPPLSRAPAVFYLNQSLPFGGAKASGNALRFAGPEGLRGLCNLKAVTEDRAHGWIQTGIPPLLAYPITSARGAWTFVQGLVRLVYGRDARQRAGGLWGIVTAR